MTHWCILRTAGNTTLQLAADLQEQGFAAWTPRGLPDQIKPKRPPRSRSRRRKCEDEDLVPILPTFVFARLPDGHDERKQYVGELVMLSEQGRFSIMRDHIRGRGYALAADASLNHVRRRETDDADQFERIKAERARAARGDIEPLPCGEEITVPSTVKPYAGMSGLVESSDGKRTWLNFGGIMGRVMIETFWLRPEEDEMKAA